MRLVVTDNEVIDIEVAKKLQAVGYNEEFDRYREPVAGTREDDVDEDGTPCVVYEAHLYPKVTWWQVLDWLRRTKGIHVTPCLESVNEELYHCMVTRLRHTCHRVRPEDGGYYTTYNEALRQGVLYAIDLIQQPSNNE